MPDAPLFEIDGLHVATVDGGTEILKGVDLVVGAGEMHALMGPNGSGKSTLASALLGSPEYEVTSGSIRFKGEDITSWPPEVRGKAGLFLAFQYPQEIPGVSMRNFLTQALQARKGHRRQHHRDLHDDGRVDGAPGHRLPRSWIATSTRSSPAARRSATRSCRWRCWSRRWPSSTRPTPGLDIDALRIVATGLQAVRSERPELGVLAITHFQRILTAGLEPDRVHVLLDGRIVESGGPELADRLEREGYERYAS